MTYALFADIHGSREGFRKLLAAPEFITADKKIFLGDGFMADDMRTAAEWYRRIAKVADNYVIGNHEAVLVGAADVEIFQPAMRGGIAAARRYYQRTAPDFLERLGRSPYEIKLGKAVARHGSFDPGDPWHHIRYIEDVQAEAPHLPTTLQFIGHGHVPFIAWSTDGLWYYQRQIYGRSFAVSSADVYLVNVGTILGSREMRQHERSFVVYDDTAQTVQFYNLETTF